ncbi:MAG: metallophosphoesterase [Actinomycetota bacterium]|nr:metallophosphoesterase [Actinomycetota bacterium]
MLRRTLAAVVALSALAGACERPEAGDGAGPGTADPPRPTAPPPGPSTTAAGPTTPDPVVAAAGDIACEPGEPVTPARCHMAATSDLLVGRGLAAVLTLGDNQYEDGALEKFRRSYDASWGRVKPITRPAAGNHDFAGGSGRGYFAYFGAAAGEAGRGWYSFEVGAWHLVALNSNCGPVGGCGPGSPQHEWLVADLAAHPARCTLAYWHHPRFSSGLHGDSTATAALWDALYRAGADLVLAGHDHHYERFAPLAPDGRIDPARGIRQFIVGTGGRSLYPTFVPRIGSELRNAETYGVLLLTLHPDGYEARFVPEAGAAFTDATAGRCH